jgi:hypothetical protein
MKGMKTFLVLAFVSILAGTAWSQDANTESRPEFPPGHLISRTTPAGPILQATVSPGAVAATKGKIITQFTITVSSAIPAATPIHCAVFANVTEQNSVTFQISNEIQDSATVNATRNGGTAKCTVIIPYSWFLLSADSDQAQLSYEIEAATGATKGGTVFNRKSSQIFDIISVPASGVTTTETVQASI